MATESKRVLDPYINLTFKSKLIGGGARPNLFEVELATLPAAVSAASWNADDFKFMCKAAALPAQNIASIDVPFRGRTFKVAGDRTIDTWTVTIINDESFNLRRAMEEWTEQIAKLDNNLGTTNPGSYMTNAMVYQLGRGSTASSTSNEFWGVQMLSLHSMSLLIFSQQTFLKLIFLMIAVIRLKNSL